MYFYDTNALLTLQEQVLKEKFVISSITLQELEDIKTSYKKDQEVKYKARKAIHILDENPDMYDVVVYHLPLYNMYMSDLEDTPDNKICACAKWYQEFRDNKLVFVSDDICCRTIARYEFDLNAIGITNNDDIDYTGFKEIKMSEEEMAYFYEHMADNIYDLMYNEYLIIKDSDGNVVDKRKWNGETHKEVFNKTIKSVYFDNLKPKDEYQSFVIDSIMSNPITAISGKAGSGKSLISLMAAMNLIESGEYDRIVILFNPVKARGASDLGFYSGEFLDKAMLNSIGNILTTKFGDRYAVDYLIQQNKLKLVSMADCRGMEISDNEILWITEASNTSVDLMKLCLSRVSSGAKVIIEGDYEAQVDSREFAGGNNGLKRVIEVFKDHKEFGYVQLQNVWRSKIAELCELL